jgi:hypothetical protein
MAAIWPEPDVAQWSPGVPRMERTGRERPVSWRRLSQKGLILPRPLAAAVVNQTACFVAKDGIRLTPLAIFAQTGIVIIMDVMKYYQSLAANRDAIMGECVADEATFALQIISHNVLKDFDLMVKVIDGKERIIFMQACREYQYSLEAIIYGNHRHAFASLRLAFELFIASIYFSAHQMKMHLWLSGHDDLLWGTLNDSDKGVFSHNFIKAFNPELGAYRAQYLGLASTVYRECSEYVHGNPETHEDTSLNIRYDAVKVASFHDKASSVRLCVLFAFVIRYLRDIRLESKATIEHLVLESFGNLPEIQAEFGMAVK